MNRRTSIQWAEEDERGGQAVLLQNHPDDCFGSEVEDSEERKEEDSAAKKKSMSMPSRADNAQQELSGTWLQTTPRKTRVKLERLDSGKHPKPGHANYSEDGAFLAERNSSKHETATNTADHEDQRFLDRHAEGPSSMLSDQAKRLLAPKAAARPPLGLRRRISNLRQPGYYASHRDDGAVFNEKNSSKGVIATNTPDHQNQRCSHLPENALDQHAQAPTSMPSNEVRKMLVPKAAARPPLGLRRRISKLRKPGYYASLRDDGDVFEKSSSKDVIVTNTPDHQNQRWPRPPENSLDEHAQAPTSVPSNRAGKLLVPKAAARPPMGLWQRIAKRREEIIGVQPESIHISPVDGNVKTEATRPPCVAKQVTTETAPPATEAFVTGTSSESVLPSTPDRSVMDNSVANARSTQARIMKSDAKPIWLLFENIAAKNVDQENQVPPRKKQRKSRQGAGRLEAAIPRKVGACRAKTPLASMDLADQENKSPPQKKQRKSRQGAGRLEAVIPRKVGACRAKTPLASMDMNAVCLRC